MLSIKSYLPETGSSPLYKVTAFTSSPSLLTFQFPGYLISYASCIVCATFLRLSDTSSFMAFDMDREHTMIITMPHTIRGASVISMNSM